MNVPREYWGEAVKFAAYFINRTLSRVLDFQTPLQKLQKLIPSPPLNNLEPRIFGCSAYVHQTLKKLDLRAIRCMFVGYADLQKGYRCYNTNVKKMYVTRDVQFHENIPFFSPSECSLQGRQFRIPLKITLRIIRVSLFRISLVRIIRVSLFRISLVRII